MENTSKAIIIVSSMLLGVMILVLAVYVFQMYGNYTSESYRLLEQSQITQFNNQFLKYYGNVTITNEEHPDGQQEKIKCTAHDIITVANLANQNNTEYGLTKYDETTYYVQVDIGSTNDKQNIQDWDEDKKIQFIKGNSTQTTKQGDKDVINIKYYYCKEVKLSDHTSRVCYIKFEENK